MRTFILTGVSLLLLAACTSSGKDTAVIGREQYTRVMVQGGQVVDPVHGKEIWLATGPLAGAEGVNANGIGIGHVFEDGASLFTVNLNILPPPAESHYVAWLTDGTQELKLGTLQSPTADARHQVSFTSDQDLRAFRTLLVSLETGDSAVRLGTLQATGDLKEQLRSGQENE